MQNELLLMGHFDIAYNQFMLSRYKHPSSELIISIFKFVPCSIGMNYNF